MAKRRSRKSQDFDPLDASGGLEVADPRQGRRGIVPVYDFDPLAEGMAAGARRKRVANTARGTFVGPSGTIATGAAPTRLGLPAGRGAAAAGGAGGGGIAGTWRDSSLWGAGPREVAKAAGKAGKVATAARFGLYGLAALTAYDAVTRVLDATEGEDNRKRVTRTERELALGEDQDASIEAMLLNEDNDSMRKMQGLRDAVGRVESSVATRDAIDLAEIIEGKKGQLEGYAAVMGPSPLEVEARFRSLFGG